MALCVLLLDDRLLRRLVPRRLADRLGEPAQWRRPPPWRRRVVGSLTAALLVVSVLVFVREMVRTQKRDELPGSVVAVLDAADWLLLSWGDPAVLRFTAPFRTINGYGLFRVMTTERPEIIVEGSNDGAGWVAYEFKWKPGDRARRPRFVAPHQPRLDWQMWFAALHPQGNAYWLERLINRLLEGSEPVLDLMGENPFPDAPPRYVRLSYYRYTFTDPADKRATGDWWRRRYLGRLTQPISRAGVRGQG